MRGLTIALFLTVILVIGLNSCGAGGLDFVGRIDPKSHNEGGGNNP